MFFVGQGFDVHAFEKPNEKRNLVLGGVLFEGETPLVGHSDADVVLHALMDALLGAAKIEGASDIGELFPDTDAAFKGVDSLELLSKVADLLKDHNFHFQNADITIICEQPKIGPYKKAMREAIAGTLVCPLTSIGVKATTTEKLGFLGRGEGIAASAICLLEKYEGNQEKR